MRLKTFISCDPHTKGKGLTHANKLEKQIWKEFSHDLATLNKIAVALRALANSALGKTLKNPLEGEEGSPAGKLLFRLHRRLESNRKLNERKKRRARTLKCELCGFDFAETYGPVGRGYIELHHKVPLSALRPTRNARIADLILLCANCHRIAHRQLGKFTSRAKRGGY